MSRIRTIKPDFWTSDQVTDCSTGAQLLFIGMWNFCDDGGVHPASAKKLKGEIFPHTQTVRKVEGWLLELLQVELIKKYEVDGREYYQVTGFNSHQRIDQPTYKHPQSDGEVPRSRPRRRPKRADFDD